MYKINPVVIPALNKNTLPIYQSITNKTQTNSQDDILVSNKIAILSINDQISAPSLRWEYDVFIDEVEKHHIVHVNVTQDQKSAHIKFIDNTEKDMLLPTGYDHISYLLQNDVQVNIIQSETLLSPIDIFLVFMQILFLVRFISIDLTAKLKNKQENDKKRDRESIQQSAKIITQTCCNTLQSDQTEQIETMRNNVMVSMSGMIAEDMLNGVFLSPTGPTNDISHILQIGYQIVANYEILDTPDKINKFVTQTYRQCRIILKKNIKQLRNIQCEIKKHKKPLNEDEINKLTADILCDLDNYKY